MCQRCFTWLLKLEVSGQKLTLDRQNRFLHSAAFKLNARERVGDSVSKVRPMAFECFVCGLGLPSDVGGGWNGAVRSKEGGGDWGDVPEASKASWELSWWLKQLYTAILDI